VDEIVNFLFEVGMLKRTPRSGWQFLDGGRESVAEHSFRTALTAMVLARMDGEVDADRAIRMALVHDLPEARTGDMNYMNQKYVQADEAAAAADMAGGLPFGPELEELLAEYREQLTPEAILVRDADQLDFLLELKERLDGGVAAARDWMPFVLRRLQTDNGHELARRIVDGDPSDWWFDKGSDWWVNGGKR
jgi:putative hydrolase of HD superfamily